MVYLNLNVMKLFPKIETIRQFNIIRPSTKLHTLTTTLSRISANDVYIIAICK